MRARALVCMATATMVAAMSLSGVALANNGVKKSLSELEELVFEKSVEIDDNSDDIDTFFDIFTELSVHFGVDSFFDVFTELEARIENTIFVAKLHYDTTSEKLEDLFTGFGEVEAKLDNTIFVAKLHYSTTSEQLEQVFKQFGEVDSLLVDNSTAIEAVGNDFAGLVKKNKELEARIAKLEALLSDGK